MPTQNNNQNKNNNHNDNNGGKPKKTSVILFYLIMVAIIFILWTIIVPNANKPTVKEISYSEFMEMVDNGTVAEVQFSDEYITILPTDYETSNVYYKTGKPAEVDNEIITQLSALDSDIVTSTAVETESIWTELIGFAFSAGTSLLIIFILYKVMTKKMSGGVMSFGKNTAKLYGEKSTGKTFEDVAGQDEAKQALFEIVDFLQHPDKYNEIGAKLPKGALLVGPPGTGKTLLAKAVAGEAHVPFFSLSGSEFVEMFVGMGASRVRDLFKQAVEKAPCIVFIDEIDAIGKSRDNMLGGNDEREQTLNQLLSEMDGFDSSKGVVILAATNRPEVLDKALLRPGRFDRRIIVDLPDLEGRKSILKVHAKNVKMDNDIDFEAIALATAGAAGADLANIINEAALRAVRAKKDKVSQKELSDAVEIVIAGEEKKSTVISEKEKKIIAYHEVGHALVSALLSHTEPVQKITIIPRTSGALGYTLQVPKEEKHLMSKQEAIDEIAVYAGGRASEELVFGEITTGASNDIQKATQIARAMITEYGMSDKFGFVSLEAKQNIYLGTETSGNYSDSTAAEIDAEIRSLITECYKKAYNLLSENRDTLDEISAILLEKENISGKEFTEILKNKGIILENNEPKNDSSNDGGANNGDANEASSEISEKPEEKASELSVNDISTDGVTGE